uniref:Uncharacterized protein n=1 Tax=Caenorhabditis japonica TaxID=281687 RepID=A0A8R1EC35_CAEJA
MQKNKGLHRNKRTGKVTCIGPSDYGRYESPQAETPNSNRIMSSRTTGAGDAPIFRSEKLDPYQSHSFSAKDHHER